MAEEDRVEAAQIVRLFLLIHLSQYNAHGRAERARPGDIKLGDTDWKAQLGKLIEDCMNILPGVPPVTSQMSLETYDVDGRSRPHLGRGPARPVLQLGLGKRLACPVPWGLISCT